jgi:uncharacterized protein (TIGR02996 family)
MMGDEGFLADIREHPDDDAPRLVYSDWLEDNGDPERAEFIRLQCRLARMDWREPGYKALEERAKKLERQNWERWLAACPAELKASRRLYFHRGFVEGANLSYEELLRYGQALLDAFPLRGVHLTGSLSKDEARLLAGSALMARIPGLRLGGGNARCNMEAMQRLLASPHLAGLRELSLRDYHLSLAALRVLARAELPALRVLDLQANSRLGDAGAEVLAAARFAEQLTELKLGGTGLGDTGAATLAGCGRLPRLRRLELAGRFGPGNRVGPVGITDLLTSPSLPSLTQIELTNNPIGAGGAEALAAWPHLGAVTDLVLRQCSLGDAGLAALAASPYLAGVVYLELYANVISARGAQALAAAAHLVHLRELDLGANKIRDAGAQALAAAPHLASLRALSLWSNEIGAPGAVALARSPYLNELRQLDLYKNHIGDAGTRALAESAIWQHHTKLDLKHNDIGDTGAAALAQCAALASLSELHLHFNKIRAAGVLSLAHSSVLPHNLNIDLRSNQVEPSQRKDVAEAIHQRFQAPKVRV